MSAGENTREMSLWPIIRDNTVQITATSLSNPTINSTCNGTVVYAKNNHLFILTGGESIAKNYYNEDGKVKVYVEVAFADETEGILFDGVEEETKYKASILTDVKDAREEIVILLVEAPFRKNGARFSNSEVVDGLRIVMCVNIYGYSRFSHVFGNISSRNVPGEMVDKHPEKSYVEYAIPSGGQIEGAGLYDLSGCLIGIHSHQIIIVTKYGAHGSPLCRGILADKIYPIICKLCYGEGVEVSADRQVSDMFDDLYRNSYGVAN